MKVLFLTFPEGHLVSDKECQSLKKGFAKAGMFLLRCDTTGAKPVDYDIILVKGWSHTWDQVKDFNLMGKPVVYLSIGTEWKLNTDLRELNKPIEDLYFNANAIIHISDYCRQSHDKIYPWFRERDWRDRRVQDQREVVIIPAREPNLPKTLKPLAAPLRLATTCIPRPVKRVEALEALCKLHGVDLVPAYGSVSDFGYYHDMDGYVHLSRKEGMPNTVLEAMAHGLPCIVTNYGGAKEAVGDAGIVIKNDPDNVPWDPDHIEEIDPVLFELAIKEFKLKHEELRKKTRERVLSELNDYVTACKFKEVFQSCV